MIMMCFQWAMCTLPAVYLLALWLQSSSKWKLIQCSYYNIYLLYQLNVSTLINWCCYRLIVRWHLCQKKPRKYFLSTVKELARHACVGCNNGHPKPVKRVIIVFIMDPVGPMVQLNLNHKCCHFAPPCGSVYCQGLNVFQFWTLAVHEEAPFWVAVASIRHGYERSADHTVMWET